MRYQNWEYALKYPSDLLGEIIKVRGIEDREIFLNVDYKHLAECHVLKGIEKAKEKIISVIDSGQKIGIFCDYDADGVCSGAIMYRALKELGNEPITYVPERKEGYSLSLEAINFFKSEDVRLVITLDCGIKNHEEILLLKKEGIDVIVVDHHQLPDKLPDAYAIVHPDLTTSGKSLGFSGGGTAYMLARCILNESGKEKWLIDMAAISSVADIVNLNSDNRIIVKYGMQVLERTKNVGLAQLLEVSGLSGKPLNTYDLGFGLAPRLNAAGRIAHPRDSYELLVESDAKKAKALALKLDRFNSSRQDILQKSIEEAIRIIEKNKLNCRKVIIIDGPWDEGIVGLIASRITDKYYRPSIVLSHLGSFLKGSSRSIEGINITNFISLAEDDLISFGGHSQAAGLSLDKKHFENVKKKFNEASVKLDDKFFQRKLKIDALVNYEDLSIKNIEDLNLLAPFGPGNSKPILAIAGVEILNSEIIGRDKSHKKIYFRCGKSENCFLLFSFEKKEYDFVKGAKFDIAFTAGVNEFRGNKKVDLILEDAKEIK